MTVGRPHESEYSEGKKEIHHVSFESNLLSDCDLRSNYGLWSDVWYHGWSCPGSFCLVRWIVCQHPRCGQPHFQYTLEGIHRISRLISSVSVAWNLNACSKIIAHFRTKKKTP